jgi:hypothetical protein
MRVLRDSIVGRSGTRPVRRRAATMKKFLLAGVGALMALMGVVWTLQGLGYIGGSGMSGVTLWAIVGPVVVIVGLAMTVVGTRGRGSRL